MRYALLCLLLTAACDRHKPASSRVGELAVAAAAGDPSAQYDLAVEFYRGDELPRNYAAAARLWRQCADRGDIDAMNNLGYLTYYGMGVQENPQVAVRLWLTASAAGQSEANFHLAYAALEGKGMATDSVEAWARLRAAERMARASADVTDRATMADAVEKLRELRPRMGTRERAAGEARARRYFVTRRNLRGDPADPTKKGP